MQTEAIFENIAERIQQEISRAQKSVFIAVAWFTNKTLFNELLDKAKGGCTVSLIISDDKINSTINYEELNYKNSRVYKVGDGEATLMHNKFCVIDYSTVISGSYNWSYKAENNFENVIITHGDTSLAEQFIAEFNNILKQFYPDEVINELVFPLNKIIKRLEILKNYMLLEDFDEFSRESEKLRDYDFNSDIREIMDCIKREEFSDAISKIQGFISKNQKLLLWSDPEIAALKLDINNLEYKLNAYDNEKIELEKLLSEFQYRHTMELGEIIAEILKLRKIKFKSDDSKFKEAEEDERQYNEQYNTEKEKEIYELTDEEKANMKTIFRKASMLCHPDKVSEEFHAEAQAIFIELKKAYDSNNFNKVTAILEDLEKGHILKTKSETINEKELLKVAIAKLRKQIKILESEIMAIKHSGTYKTIVGIDNWDEYFSDLRIKLQNELEQLKLELV